MLVGVSDLGNIVSNVTRYLRCAFWCLIVVAILEIVACFLWTHSLASHPGLSFVDVFLYAVFPVVAVSLIPTLVAIPLVSSVSRSFVESAFRGDFEGVARCRKVMAVLGGVTLLSLVIPGVLLILAFLKSEPVEFALLSRRIPVPPAPYGSIR